MKRIKIPWEKFNQNKGPLLLAALILFFTPLVLGLIWMSAIPLVLYLIGAIWLLWNELGDNNEKA